MGSPYHIPVTPVNSPIGIENFKFIIFNLQLHESYHCATTRGNGRFAQLPSPTWIAPAPNYGFLVDTCYGYGKAVELPDGSLLVADQGSGGHTTADARNMSLRLLRIRIRPDHSGIDLLPAMSR